MIKVKLYNDDYLNILKSFDDNTIDLVFTSPPFKEKDLNLTKEQYFQWYEKAFSELYRVANKVVVIIHSPTKMNEIISKYPPKRVLIWGKQTERFYAASWRYNPIYVYEKNSDINVNRLIWTDTFGISPIKEFKKRSKYQDPLLLYEILIKMFKNCNSVLDPFMGCGTAGMACINLEKDFIGIEKDINIYNIAVNNLKVNNGIK